MTTLEFWGSAATLSSMREELKHLLAHKKDSMLADKVRQVRRSYFTHICKERSDSWRRFCSKADSAREVSTLVQMVGNYKIRGVI